MILRCAVLLAPLVVAIAGCSGSGPDVVDPRTQERTQVSLLAVDVGGTSELLQYKEQGSQLLGDQYTLANGAPLGKKIDAIYEDSDRLFLHHREEGTITVLNLKGKRIGQITGFPTKGEGMMCSMAFSNLSQAWVACYGSRDLYHVDAVNNVIADTIPMTGVVTNVGTVGTEVFVGLEQSDGSCIVNVIRSNDGGAFAVVKTFSVNSPVIFSTPSSDGRDFILLTAGNQNGVKPHIYYIDVEQMEVLTDVDLEIDPLVAYVGMEPNYVTYSKLDNIYLALPTYLAQIPYGGQVYEWLPGGYSTVAVDPDSDLLYAYTPGSRIVKRKDAAGNDLPDLSVPADVNSIFFLGTNRVQ